MQMQQISWNNKTCCVFFLLKMSFVSQTCFRALV